MKLIHFFFSALAFLCHVLYFFCLRFEQMLLDLVQNLAVDLLIDAVKDAILFTNHDRVLDLDLGLRVSSHYAFVTFMLRGVLVVDHFL